ncbi:hypothetical protein IIC44_00050 [Patescibacteria group bacterium]|nr:hypothetical protein [Patescibacteria group bacterium]
MNQELHSFVKESLTQQKSRASIKEVLFQAGWQDQEITKALGSFAEVNFSIPVPKKKPYLAAREAFLYLVSFITLYITAFSFGALIFSFVDIWFPDPLRLGGDVPRTAIASLIVAFPIFLVITRALQRGVAQDSERKDSLIKKWLTYLTLVIAAGILIGDLITVLSSLLGGEVTMRFFLKAFVVFGVAGSIFGYYLSDLQKEEKES